LQLARKHHDDHGTEPGKPKGGVKGGGDDNLPRIRINLLELNLMGSNWLSFFVEN
jgi:hypothetical protein